MITALNVDKLRLDMGDYVLSVAALRKRVGTRYALDGIDFDVKRGSCTALVGPAGAGKSLTLACIAGIAKPTAGRIRYFGYEMKGRGQERVARMGIVRTSPTPAAFGDMTVLEAVTVGALLRHSRLRRAEAHAREMLAITQLSTCGELRFEALDATDRARLELARALATDPQLLLLDDLAAHLEPPAIAAFDPIFDAVRARGITIVAAARTLERCPLVVDDIVEIDRGKTAEMNVHAALNLRA